VHKPFRDAALAARRGLRKTPESDAITDASPLAQFIDYVKSRSESAALKRGGQQFDDLVPWFRDHPYARMKIGGADFKEQRDEVISALNDARRGNVPDALIAAMRYLETEHPDEALWLFSRIEALTQFDAGTHSEALLASEPLIPRTQSSPTVGVLGDDVLFLGWPMQTGPAGSRSAADAIRYNSGKYPFRDRTAELELLSRFLGTPEMVGSPEAFQWFFISGDMGTGKTRLALEFTRTIRPAWHAGRLGRDHIDNFDAARWEPVKDTLIVFDYPEIDPAWLKGLLSNFHLKASSFRFRVRVLLMDRAGAGSWAQRLLEEDDGASAAIRSHQFVLGEKGALDWPLPPLSINTTLEIIKGRFVDENVPIPSDDLLWRTALRSDPRVGIIGREEGALPRPLCVAAAAEMMVGAAAEMMTDAAKTELGEIYTVGMVDGVGIFQSIINRDRKTRWSRVLSQNGILNPSQEEELWLHENLVAFASSCGGLSPEQTWKISDKIRPYFPDLRVGGQRPLNKSLIREITGVKQDYRGVSPLNPPVLGQTIFWTTLKRLSDYAPDAKEMFLNEVFSLGDPFVNKFLWNCIINFPERFDDLPLLIISQCDSREAAASFIDFARIALAWSSMIPNLEFIEQLLESVDALKIVHGPFESIDVQEARTISQTILIAIHHTTGDHPSRMVDRLCKLIKNTPVDLELAQLIAEIIPDFPRHIMAKSEWGTSKDFADRLDSLMLGMDRLYAEHGGDPGVAKRHGWLDAELIIDATNRRDWSRVVDLLPRIGIMAALYKDRPEMAANIAPIWASVAYQAGLFQQWGIVSNVASDLYDLALLHLNTPELAIVSAKVLASFAINLINNQDAKNFASVSLMCEELRLAFPACLEVAVIEAKLFYQCIVHVLQHGTYTPFYAVLVELLKRIYERDSEHSEIAQMWEEVRFRTQNIPKPEWQGEG
jgi:hypothetical protein